MSSNKKTPAVSEKNERKQRGRVDRDAVMFPVAPPKVELPVDYPDWLANLKQRIQSERLRIIIASNAAMQQWSCYIGILVKKFLKNSKLKAGDLKLLIACLSTCVSSFPR